MDRIQHFLWRYCDPNDPTYPGSNSNENAIKEFYIFIDEIIGEFLEALGPDDRLIVISDHGHGMRCTHCFNINENLRKHGYVRSVVEGKVFSKQLIIEKIKNGVLNFMHEHNLEDHIGKIAKLVPNAKSYKKGKHITKSCNNRAYASDFTGTNPFGGVCINRNLVSDYTKTRQEVMDLLAGAKVDGNPVFEWIMKREEMFSGKYLERLPDLLFCLQPKYGVNWSLHCDEITINPTHKKISGGHREYGVFFSNMSADNFEPLPKITMENFFCSMLTLFDLDECGQSSGRSFIKK